MVYAWRDCVGNPTNRSPFASEPFFLWTGRRLYFGGFPFTKTTGPATVRIVKGPISFEILKQKGRARAGILRTAHGEIRTPAFVPVATKATIKAMTPEQTKDAGAEVILQNTYHLYLQPGERVVDKAGGVGKFMGWSGPTMTDSGGFQVFSLGAAFGQNVSKVAREDLSDHKTPAVYDEDIASQHGRLAVVDEEGVTFTSHLDGTLHRFTPERSMEIQHALGADMIFAFDEPTASSAPHGEQREALDRTHRWAERSWKAHKLNTTASQKQALFGIVQGGRFEDLRRESARAIADMPFDGFGVGGSYVKEDLDTAVGWVCDELPEDRPRHLLGIGEPEDLISGIAKGVDLFDCVAPTRAGRQGTVYTRAGKIHMLNARFTEDYGPLEEGCLCYTCRTYTRAYVSHLFRAREMLAATLASAHNLHFLLKLVAQERDKILN